jgi:Flp pilus assembly protein TadD
MAEALAYAGRRLVDGGGDLDEAISHLLRAWLRAPEDGRVIHDLARAYAARGDRERAAELFAAARDAGFAGADDPASEP